MRDVWATFGRGHPGDGGSSSGGEGSLRAAPRWAARRGAARSISARQARPPRSTRGHTAVAASRPSGWRRRHQPADVRRTDPDHPAPWRWPMS